jgi:SAM-dependent methyltransferase
MWNDILNIIDRFEAIEIGGPTPLFQNNNIYNKLKSIDGINMKNNMWQHVSDEFICYNKKGIQYIGDCIEENLYNNIEKKYDIVLNSHQIEHVANPLKYLYLLEKIIKKDSYMLSIIPYKNAFWDKTRNFTSLEHLLEDYENDINENDLTHLKENIDTGWFEQESAKNNAYDNFNTRILHHHCFDMLLVKQMFEIVNYETINCFIYDTLNIVYFGKKKNKKI